jgi:hypothetical protein
MAVDGYEDVDASRDTGGDVSGSHTQTVTVAGREVMLAAEPGSDDDVGVVSIDDVGIVSIDDSRLLVVSSSSGNAQELVGTVESSPVL